MKLCREDGRRARGLQTELLLIDGPNDGENSNIEGSTFFLKEIDNHAAP